MSTIPENDPATRKKYSFHNAESLEAIAGTLILAPGALPPSIRLIGFDKERLIEDRPIAAPSEIAALRSQFDMIWVHVDGLGNGRILYEIGRIFQLHSLALEDVGHCHQRAKVEEFDQHTFLVARAIKYDRQLKTTQLSVFLGANFVVTFQEHPRPEAIDPLVERLRRSSGKSRPVAADYLVYMLLDGLIDGYFPVLERYADQLETLERDILASRSDEVISQIHDVKTELLLIRRSLWPHREAIHSLVRDPNPLISDATRIYLRDCQDHAMQLFELVETYREVTSDLRDLHLSSASHRMNEIMKVLTIVSTIFIPLSFIAGLYGMNFDAERSPWNMPELRWYYGYPFAYIQMAAIAGGLLYFFRRKGWIGAAKKKQPR